MNREEAMNVLRKMHAEMVRKTIGGEAQKEIVEKLKNHLDNLETALFKLLLQPRQSGWWDLINAEAKAMAADLDRAIRNAGNEGRRLIAESERFKRGVTKCSAVEKTDMHPPP